MRYVVERFIPGAREVQLAAVAAVGAAFAVPGLVRYLGSTLIPDDQVCFCLFEAASAESVRQANVRSGLSFERVLEAISIGSSLEESPTPIL